MNYVPITKSSSALMPGARLQTGGLFLLGWFQECLRSGATRTPACERVESPFTGPRSSRVLGLMGGRAGAGAGVAPHSHPTVGSRGVWRGGE